jgi:hypothetical protein
MHVLDKNLIDPLLPLVVLKMPDCLATQHMEKNHNHQLTISVYTFLILSVFIYFHIL